MANDLIVSKTIKIHADKTKVWDALINPEKIKQYLFGTETISEWKVGSPIIFQGEWEGKAYQDKGTILQLIPNELFRYNYWSSFSNTEDIPENYASITFVIEEQNENSLLTLTQDGFVNEAQRDHSDKNWEMILNLMKELIEK